MGGSCIAIICISVNCNLGWFDLRKKRLLFFLHSLTLGGAERLVYQMCCELGDDYELGICCLDGRGGLWESCEKLGVKLYLVQRKPGWSVGNFTACRRVLRSFRPDIIHAHQYTPYFFAVCSKLFSFPFASSRARLIFTEHGRHYPDNVSLRRWFANKFFQQLTYSNTAVCQFTATAMRENEGIKQKPISVIYNGIFSELLEEKPDVMLKKELEIDGASSLVGYIGSLREVKNMAFLLEAFSLVAQRLLDVDLVLIGDGPLRRELEEQAQGLQINGRVHFLGAKNPAVPYLRELDTLVLPSQSEACSLTLLESMRAGVPIIATNVGGNPELIVDGDSGILVELGDPAQLAEAILKTLRNGPEVQSQVGRAKELVENRFSFSSMLNAYKEHYELS